MWIHESFTCYSESLYLEYWFGKEAGEEYNRGLRKDIMNKEAMIGSYDVNNSGSDLYDKGANVLGMIRQIINDDEKWRMILRGLGEEYYHQTVDTEQIESYISEEAGIDLSSLFDQYLRDTRIPVFEYYFTDGNLEYKWSNVESDFTMPVDVYFGETLIRLTPNSNWQSFITIEQELIVHPNYYIETMKSQSN
jgi:aminopeptidase N